MTKIPLRIDRPVRSVMRSVWFWLLCPAAIGAVMVLTGATPPNAAPPPMDEPAPRSGTLTGWEAPNKNGQESVMDAPLRLIAQASKTYRETTDYTCTLIKNERIHGQMQPENVMAMKVRAEPFSVYLKWSQPRQSAGQEVSYVAGRNSGMMRVKPKGIASLAGWVSVDPNDPRALENSHHKITEAGIGNLIARTVKAWDVDKRLDKTQVRVADYEFNHRPVTRVETLHADNGNGAFQYYRSVIYFDKENHLPIRVENYDWPRQAGSKDGELLEVFSFVDLKLNANLPASTFER